MEKKCEISKIFLRQKCDVCAVRETKLKGKGEVMFGEVVGRLSGVRGGRARKGVALLLSIPRLTLFMDPACSAC